MINIEQWHSFSSVLRDMVTDAISTELMQMMDSLCEQCGMTTDHFINSTFEVADDNMFSVIGIYYTSYIVYSSPEGSVTASTLIALLQQWLLEKEENEIQVTVGDVHLVMYKPCGLDNSNPASKLLCLTALSKSQQTPTSNSPVESSLNNTQNYTSAVIAGTFIGGVLTGTLCSVVVSLSWSVEKDLLAMV